MPWNGCRFEGDPSTPAELLSKEQYNSDGYNRTLLTQCDTRSVFTGGVGREVRTSWPNFCGETYQYAHYECKVTHYDWDGGLCYLGDSYFAQGLDAGAITLDIIGRVAGLTSLAIKQTALNDYKKDLRGAENKMRVASNNYAQSLKGIDQTGNQIVSLGGNLDGLSGQLEQIKQSLTFQWNGIQSILSELSSLNSALGTANNQLTKANQDLAYASNRANFPAGIAGSTAQRNAIKQANARIKDASLKISDLEVDISDKGSELQSSSDSYNQTGQRGEAVSNQILTNQQAIQNLKSTYDSQLSGARNAVSLRNGAIGDVKNAQTNFAEKLETSMSVAQGAVGASGASQTLKYASTGDYLKATGAGINTGIDVGSYNVPGSLGLNPFIPLLKTAISQGFDNLQSGGNVENYALNLGESLIGLKSSQQIFRNVEGALLIMDKDSYMAWQILAQQTHEGVGVLGAITTTASPFMGGIAVTPFIPMMIPVAQSIASGFLSTAVEAGFKFSMKEGLSAPLGSGRLSGVSVLLFGTVGSIVNGPINAMEKAFDGLFGNDESGNSNTAVEIQRMAQTGAEQLEIPQFKISVDMRKIGSESDPLLGVGETSQYKTVIE
jgi:predicted  nucleic acid-binding Zn-ribbon protein